MTAEADLASYMEQREQQTFVTEVDERIETSLAALDPLVAGEENEAVRRLQREQDDYERQLPSKLWRRQLAVVRLPKPPREWGGGYKPPVAPPQGWTTDFVTQPSTPAFKVDNDFACGRAARMERYGRMEEDERQQKRQEKRRVDMERKAAAQRARRVMRPASAARAQARDAASKEVKSKRKSKPR
jgi:hypothetical protein